MSSCLDIRMLYKTDYLHSLFSPSYNTMAKSNNKTEQKLPGKAGRNSTKGMKKNDGTPTKQSSKKKSPAKNDGMTVMNMAKKKSPAKNDGTPTKQSCEKKSPAKNDGMPAKQYCPQESEMPTKNKPKMTLPPKKNETPIKDSPPKAKEMPKNPYVPSPRNRNNGDKVKEIHKILILEKSDGTPFGWAFIGFYDVKEWLKSLCNRDGSLTSLGDETFQPFTNLSIRWILNSELADKIWVIYIDTNNGEINGSFPVTAHVLYANKIARAVLSSNVQWVPGTFEVTEHKLTESQEEDLNRQVDAKIAPTHAVREQELFLQQIASCDAMLESLI